MMSHTPEEAYWLEQSILNFFDHRRATYMLQATQEGQETTPNELVALAISETVDRFRSNLLNWTEEEIVRSIDAYLKAPGHPT
jgi:hypothetical protein